MDPTSTSTGPEPMVDPVEHLRAAALSTLKGKRRKPAPEKPPPPIPTRPVPSTDSFQLDYGFEENNKSSDKATSDRQTYNLPHVQIDPKTFAVDEGQSREEGEISEEEEPPAKRNVSLVRKISTSPKPILPTPTVEPMSTCAPVVHDGQSPSAPAPTLLERLSEPAYHTPTLKQEEVDHSDALMDSVSILHQDPIFSVFVDPDHVRPGLALTQAEYDTVKDVVLDLLGWGIPFGHLLESGISRTVLYYVFSELNLRLPDDFDMSGIIPYTPETITHQQQPQQFPSSAWQIGPIPFARARTPPSAMMVPVALLESPVDSDLHDMERQRRQELMARKAAAQASRRLKQSNHVQPSMAVKPVVSNDVIMNSIVPSDNVDDFLKSLGPVEELKPPQLDIVLPKPNQILDEMQVDAKSDHEHAIEWDSRKRSDKSTPSDHSLSEPPPSSSELPPTSVASTTTNFSLPSEEAVPIAPTVSSAKAPLRRGTKRPVASDFVDFESSPRKHTSASRIERPNGNSHPTGITRRLTAAASFHNIGGSRRCVIDLSDSEDDDERYPPGLQPLKHVYEESAWQRKEIGMRQSTHPSPVPFKPSDTMSPASLAQKELEIRKMRELIAKREEETRLRKLAMTKSQSNSGTRTPLAMTNSSSKAEDVDALMTIENQTPTNEQTPKNIRDPDSATPPPEKSGIASPDDEDQSSARVHVSESSHGVEIFQVHPKADQRLDLAPERQETQVLNHSGSASDKDLVRQRSIMTEGSVDADTSPSPSTQMESSSTTISSALQKQDAKRPDLTPSANSSNESQPQDNLTTFSAYRSPFDSYPRLRDHPQRMLSDPFSISYDLSSVSSSHTYQPSRSSLPSDSRFASAKPSSSTSSFFSSTDFQLPDLKALKLASTVQLLDPLKRICQYEIPGGGTCRDEHCEDIHLSRLESANHLSIVEPSDEDTAQYLFNTMPSSWLAQRQINSSSRILKALRQVHHKTLNNPSSFEERVTQALSSIGSPPTP